MALIKWNKSHSVGITKMDEQHQILFDRINELYEAIKIGKGREFIGNTLDAVTQYAVTHFSEEEALMKKHRFPELAAHRAVHKEFLRELRGFKTKHKTGIDTLSMDVLIFLHKWLKQHINQTDKKYGKLLNKKGVF
jgi:hemerythrin-like metal-binding protein